MITIRLVVFILLLFPVSIVAQSGQIAELAQEKETINKIIDSLEHRLEEIDAKMSQVNPEKKLEAMMAKYGKNKGRMIAAGKVWNSISFEMARDSWGEPTNIQKTAVSSGETQKWSYAGGRYLYFKNGRLESWRE